MFCCGVTLRLSLSEFWCYQLICKWLFYMDYMIINSIGAKLSQSSTSLTSCYFVLPVVFKLAQLLILIFGGKWLMAKKSLNFKGHWILVRVTKSNQPSWPPTFSNELVACFCLYFIYQAYILTNVFIIPKHILLPEDAVHRGVSYTEQDETRIDTEIQSLEDKIKAVRWI